MDCASGPFYYAGYVKGAHARLQMQTRRRGAAKAAPAAACGVRHA